MQQQGSLSNLGVRATAENRSGRVSDILSAVAAVAVRMKMVRPALLRQISGRRRRADGRHGVQVLLVQKCSSVGRFLDGESSVAQQMDNGTLVTCLKPGAVGELWQAISWDWGRTPSVPRLTASRRRKSRWSATSALSGASSTSREPPRSNIHLLKLELFDGKTPSYH